MSGEELASSRTDEHRCLEVLKTALKALGIELSYVSRSKEPWFTGSYWQLRSINDGYVKCIAIDDNKIYTGPCIIIGFRTLDALQHQLSTCICTFIVDEKPIENPYLGCRSLEEMMVKCDLLGEGD